MNEKKKENLNNLKEYYYIKNEIGKNWRTLNTNLFLINRQWYYSWKNYVNKEYFDEIYKLNPNKKKKNENEDTKELKWEEKPSPGPISNDKIIMNLNSFYNDGDINNPENYIIKQDLSFKTNIKIIHEKLWNFYYNKFGGGPKICYIINSNIDKDNKKNENENNKDKLFQLNKTEIKLIFLPKKEEIIGNDELINQYFSVENIKSIFIPKNKLVTELIEKIVDLENRNLINNKNNHYKEKINVNELKFWLYSLNEFNIENLYLLMKDYFGKEVLNNN